MLTWARIGDLHASDEDGWHSLELLTQIVAEINAQVKQDVDFVYRCGGRQARGGRPGSR